MKRILSVTFSGVLSLFLAVVLLAGALSIFFYRTVGNQQLLVSAGQSSGYTDELYEEIKYKWENLLAITGVMDTDPVMEVLTPEVVQEAALSYLRDAYTGTTSVDTQFLYDELETKVRDYAYSNNIHATPQVELDQNINDLVSACMKEYTNSIKIPLLPKLLGAVSKVNSYLKIVPIICAVCTAGLLLFIFFLQSNRANVLYYALIAVATNAVLILGANRLAGHYRLLDRLPVEVSALRTLVVSYLSTLLGRLQSYGEVFLVTGVLLLLLYVLTLVLTVLADRRKKRKIQDACQ